ncbi:TIGR03620 family F420-dependent LLM class oxidoreductase [Amycolatopsis sp. NPDC058986]|uniref:TIGR03620 family F420-dependent LLM class oxidoreductase n=1 Tax=unclassified Amycolatopsis TaxID=2618356 RepID=UPI00366B724C
MTELGPIGAVSVDLNTAEHAVAVDTTKELEAAGFSTLWLPGSGGDNLERVAQLVRATSGIGIATGILSVDAVSANEVGQAYAELERDHPGRFVVGLGGAHGPRPFATMHAFLDILDSTPPRIPLSARILSALGPRMLDLARERAAGAFPYLITPEYVTTAREALGPGKKLPVWVEVIPEIEPDTARERAREALGFFLTLPHYATNFRRMGFTAGEIGSAAPRLIDGLVAWGDLGTIVRRLREYLDAGADQVAVNIDRVPRELWRPLADALRS